MGNKMQNIFATCIEYDGVGVLLRGKSGAGKSILALDLMDRARMLGLDACLVSDDRVLLSVDDGELVGAAPSNIAGQIELRGYGVVSRPAIEKTRIQLVIDLVGDVDRMPENDEFETEIAGVRLARCPVPDRSLVDCVHQRLLVVEALECAERKS